MKALKGHIDEWYRGFDLDYPDAARADRFIADLKGYEAAGRDAAVANLRLPNDHTHGATRGQPTPGTYVADNDLALGRMVEAVSHSRFWPQTAIFVVEDDSQNGPDHVDAHRTVALVGQSLRAARRGGFHDVFDQQHVAHDGTDPGPASRCRSSTRRPGPCSMRFRTFPMPGRTTRCR